jgi:choline dehydrogenase-like flavoprotein
MTDLDQCDYLVIDGGIAGCIVARRLSLFSRPDHH